MKDPLIELVQAELIAEQERQKAQETGIQTEIQTVSQTIPQTGGETANTAQKQRKTIKSDSPEKTQKQDSNNVSKNIETSPKNDSKNEENEGLLNEDLPEENQDHEDAPDYIKQSPDPLDDMIYDPGDTTIEEQIEKSTGESAKSLDTLVVIGEMVMNYLDNSKAQICAAISGNDPAMYASDQKAKKALIEATKNYVQEIGLKPPSPTQTFLLAVGMWLLPPLGMAALERFELMPGKKKKAAAPQQQSTPAPASPKPTTAPAAPKEEAHLQEEEPTGVDYSTTKEFQENRRLFDRHAKGTYRHLSNGTYANVDLATEYPSPEILELLEAGHNNAAIREILYEE